MLQYQIKAEEERSTHFLAIRVTDPELVANLCRVQDSIVALDSNLRDCCIKPGLFHITIDQLRLEGPERVLRAMMERLRPVVEEMFEDQASAILDIDGLGNFGQRVVYAKVTHRLLFFLISIHISSSGKGFFSFTHHSFSCSGVAKEPVLVYCLGGGM